MNDNYLKVNFQRTEQQVALAKQLGSKKVSDSMEAAEAVAQVVARPLLQVIEQAPVFANFFQTQSYDAGTPPSIPLDTFFDVRQRAYLNVWSQSQPGGTASNFIQGLSEMFVQTYELWGAASLNKNYAAAARLEVIARTLERLAQEILIKQNINATNILMSSLASAVIDGNAANTATSNLQVVRSATQGVFQLDDFNTLMIKYRRIVASWVGGTPVGVRASLTDLIGSPEWMGQIRGIAYQPQNTRNGYQTSVGTPTNSYGGATSLAAPEDIRSQIFRSAGLPSLFDVNLHEYNELGTTVGQSQGVYNQVFANYAGATQYAGYGGGSAAVFSPTTEQIVVGLNTSMFDLVRLRENGENGAFTLMADDQYANVRSGKVGWVGNLKEGYVSVDNRAKVGIIF